MTAPKGVFTHPAAVAFGVIALCATLFGVGYRVRAAQADEKVTEAQVEQLSKNIIELSRALTTTTETVGRLNERLSRLEGTVSARLAVEAR